jgi:hypothetical protein
MECSIQELGLTPDDTMWSFSSDSASLVDCSDLEQEDWLVRARLHGESSFELYKLVQAWAIRTNSDLARKRGGAQVSASQSDLPRNELLDIREGKGIVHLSYRPFRPSRIPKKSPQDTILSISQPFLSQDIHVASMGLVDEIGHGSEKIHIPAHNNSTERSSRLPRMLADWIDSRRATTEKYSNSRRNPVHREAEVMKTMGMKIIVLSRYTQLIHLIA